MKTVEFLYNRHKGNMIEGLVIGIFWIIGFMLWIYLYNHVFVFDIGGYPTLYWEQHKELRLVITILVPIMWMIVSVYPAGKLGRLLMERHGKVEIFGNYAILYVKGKEIRIDGKNTQLSMRKISWSLNSRRGGLRAYPHTSQKIHPMLYIYTLHINSEKYVITESYREGYKKTSFRQRWKKERVNLSLTEAMSAIGPFVTMHQEKEQKQTIFIGNIPIILGDTLSSVFDNGPYYVEYNNLIRAEGVPLVTCLVRERANPIHVVGDIGFADDAQHRSTLSEAILRTLPIIDGVALNERIANEYFM